MGRASKEQAGRNRQAVVEAASRLLRAKGLDGVGVRELMATAGLTQGAFSKQFTSKDALAAEACALAFEGAERAFAAVMQGGSSGRSRRLADDYFRPKSAEQACPMVTLAIDVAPEDSALRPTFAHGLERLAHVVAGDPPAPERLVLLAAMVGASILSKAGENTELAERMKAAVAAFSDTMD
jgi:TetR/AcrR family transcriptional repressor of nem operon